METKQHPNRKKKKRIIPTNKNSQRSPSNCNQIKADKTSAKENSCGVHYMLVNYWKLKPFLKNRILKKNTEAPQYTWLSLHNTWGVGSVKLRKEPDAWLETRTDTSVHFQTFHRACPSHGEQAQHACGLWKDNTAPNMLLPRLPLPFKLHFALWFTGHWDLGSTSSLCA